MLIITCETTAGVRGDCLKMFTVVLCIGETNESEKFAGCRWSLFELTLCVSDSIRFSARVNDWHVFAWRTHSDNIIFITISWSLKSS